MNKTLNFDLFLAEKNNDRVDVTVYGKVYSIPAEIPAIVPVMMARAENDEDPNSSTRMVVRAADAMFGVDNVTEMCSRGLTAKQLVALVQNTFQTINGDNAENESEEYTDEDSRKVVNMASSEKK